MVFAAKGRSLSKARKYLVLLIEEKTLSQMESKARCVKREATTEMPSGCADIIKKKKLKSECFKKCNSNIKMEESDVKQISSESEGSLTVKNTVSSESEGILTVSSKRSLKTIIIGDICVATVGKRRKNKTLVEEVVSMRKDNRLVTGQPTQNKTSLSKKEDLKSSIEDEVKVVKKKVLRGKEKKVGQQKRESKQDVQNVQKVVRSQKKSHLCSMYVGAHVSAQGGVHKSVTEAALIGASAFALFLRNQRQWNSKPLEDDVTVKFKAACTQHNFSSNMILPHGSYLMNLGSPDSEKLQKSRDLLVDELHRCEKLGLTLYNFHPGSTCGETDVENCLHTIAESINIGHSQSKYVITVLENMSCQGNTIGGKFEELRGIIDQVKDKSRVGVCLDTCHAFAAGFDLATEEGFKDFVKSFDDIVGFQYLKAMHLNDSKGIRGSHRDLHENIGKGKIGLKGFSYVMNEPMFKNIPMILETPGDVGYDKEIQLLHSLCKDKEVTCKQ